MYFFELTLVLLLVLLASVAFTAGRLRGSLWPGAMWFFSLLLLGMSPCSSRGFPDSWGLLAARGQADSTSQCLSFRCNVRTEIPSALAAWVRLP